MRCNVIVVLGVAAPRSVGDNGTAQTTGGSGEQLLGDVQVMLGGVVADDRLVERADHDGEGLLTVERGRVPDCPMAQPG
jgi:hypothetical protein